MVLVSKVMKNFSSAKLCVQTRTIMALEQIMWVEFKASTGVETNLKPVRVSFMRNKSLLQSFHYVGKWHQGWMKVIVFIWKPIGHHPCLCCLCILWDLEQSLVSLCNFNQSSFLFCSHTHIRYVPQRNPVNSGTRLQNIPTVSSGHGKRMLPSFTGSPC